MVTLLNTKKKCRVSVYDNKTKSIFLNLYSMNEKMLEKAFSILMYYKDKMTIHFVQIFHYSHF